MNYFRPHLQNPSPREYDRLDDLERSIEDLKDTTAPIDDREVFDFIRDIKDPEFPCSLEQLGVLQLNKVKVEDKNNKCYVEYTPTIPHCSMATLIGLAIRVQLDRMLPRRFKTDVRIESGTHDQEAAVNKQLADKERVAAALENSYLRSVIDETILLPEEQELPTSIKQLLEDKNLLDNPKVKYILHSRQSVKSFRRWLDVENVQKDQSSLLNNCKNTRAGCCGGSSCG